MPKFTYYPRTVLYAILIILPVFSIAQSPDKAKNPISLSGVITVTNKGISSIPNLTLGKPAAIFSLSAGRNLRFEPEFRFALEGKPWMFIFWWRYDLMNTDKFLLKVRANPTVAFKNVSVNTGNTTSQIIKANRTITSDLTTSYFPTKNISIGTYYMYVYGVEKDAVKNTHYLALRTAFSNVKLSSQLFLTISPSVYYLKMDKNHGFYMNTGLNLAKRKFPLSVSAIVNKTIHTQIPIGEDFLWNVSLVYTFNNKYLKQ